MNDDLPLLVAMAAGASLTTWLVLSWLTRLIDQVPQPSLPTSTRALPGLWRWLPWPTHAAATWAAPFLGRQVRLHLVMRLRRAGLEHVLSAERFVGGQCVSAVLACMPVVVLCRLDDPQWAWYVAAALAAGAALPLIWLRETTAARERSIVRALPFYLDIVTLALEAGSNLTGAIQHAVDKGPRGPLCDELSRLLRDIRAGSSRPDALRAMAARIGLAPVTQWVSAVLSAERQGASLGPILRAQAEQRRNERFLRAEAMALKAPVKMLFPLITCIFPCTFVIVFFPIIVKVIREGILG